MPGGEAAGADAMQQRQVKRRKVTGGGGEGEEGTAAPTTRAPWLAPKRDQTADPHQDKKMHGYKYVYYDKANRTFHACLSCHGRTINFGYVRTPLDCARAVDVMLIALGRPPVNFPDDTCGTASWRRNSDYKKRIAVKVSG